MLIQEHVNIKNGAILWQAYQPAHHSHSGDADGSQPPVLATEHDQTGTIPNIKNIYSIYPIDNSICYSVYYHIDEKLYHLSGMSSYR